MKSLALKGIAWNHSRALPPLVASAQRFEEYHPNVRIVWEKRSLHEFGHTSLAELARIFDLLVVDHPMMGEAADVLLNLRPMLSAAEWDDLKEDSAGPSFDGYVWIDWQGCNLSDNLSETILLRRHLYEIAAALNWITAKKHIASFRITLTNNKSME